MSHSRASESEQAVQLNIQRSQPCGNASEADGSTASHLFWHPQPSVFGIITMHYYCVFNPIFNATQEPRISTRSVPA
jgi:hypothetical protein